MSTQATQLTEEFAAVVGATNVLTAADRVAGYVADWTGQWRGSTLAVVRPGSTAEVAAVLELCHRAGVAVVPQGGNTGLVGGSIPMHGEVLLSTARLSRIEEVDPIGRTLAAGAGVTVAEAQRAAREHGLDLGADLASRESATLGGIVATNAGGVRVIKHGDTRSRLVGVEAVLSDGRVLTRWKKLAKDNVGYDLPGLLAGSEGTLAVITRVLLRLVEPAAEAQVALAGLASIEDGLGLLRRLEREGLTIEAAEFMTRAGVALVCERQGLRDPLDVPAPFYLLVEVSGGPDVEGSLLQVLADAEGALLDAVVEAGPAPRLWGYREMHTESLSAASETPVLKLDVATPLAQVGVFLRQLTAGLAQDFPDAQAVCFGHVGVGNIHVNLLGVTDALRSEATDFVLRLVAARDGSVSAEHGVGRAKAHWIGLGRGAVDLQVMSAIRSALDPAGLLNPHILIPVDQSSTNPSRDNERNHHEFS